VFGLHNSKRDGAAITAGEIAFGARIKQLEKALDEKTKAERSLLTQVAELTESKVSTTTSPCQLVPLCTSSVLTKTCHMIAYRRTRAHAWCICAYVLVCIDNAWCTCTRVPVHPGMSERTSRRVPLHGARNMTQERLKQTLSSTAASWQTALERMRLLRERLHAEAHACASATASEDSAQGCLARLVAAHAAFLSNVEAPYLPLPPPVMHSTSSDPCACRSMTSFRCLMQVLPRVTSINNSRTAAAFDEAARRRGPDGSNFSGGNGDGGIFVGPREHLRGPLEPEEWRQARGVGGSDGGAPAGATWSGLTRAAQAQVVEEQAAIRKGLRVKWEGETGLDHERERRGSQGAAASVSRRGVATTDEDQNKYLAQLQQELTQHKQHQQELQEKNEETHHQLHEQYRQEQTQLLNSSHPSVLNEITRENGALEKAQKAIGNAAMARETYVNWEEKLQHLLDSTRPQDKSAEDSAVTLSDLIFSANFSGLQKNEQAAAAARDHLIRNPGPRSSLDETESENVGAAAAATMYGVDGPGVGVTPVGRLIYPVRTKLSQTYIACYLTSLCWQFVGLLCPVFRILIACGARLYCTSFD
jgi:hypothetical protein